VSSCPDCPKDEYTWEQHVQECLESLIANLDYDLHKGIECGEEDGLNRYPEITADFLESLRHFDK
jgi:hypothetical protein